MSEDSWGTRSSSQNENYESHDVVNGNVMDTTQTNAQLPFYSHRVNTLEEENQRLTEECLKLNAKTSANQKREEDLIESLIEVQLRADRLESEAETYRRRIKALSSQVRFQEDGDKDSATLNEASSRRNVVALEREIDLLRSQLNETRQQAYPKASNWKYIEAQRDRLEARRELSVIQATCDSLRDKLETIQAAKGVADREFKAARAEAEASRTAHMEHATGLEAQIERLTNQTLLLRRKGAKLAAQEFRQMEQAEMEELHHAVQTLRNEVGRLKYLCDILRSTCTALREQMGHVGLLETEVTKLRGERRELRRKLSHCRNRSEDRQQASNPSKLDMTSRKVLQLEVENRRQRKLVEQLRSQLARADPSYASRYHYITGV